MMLVLLIALPLIGGVCAWLAGEQSKNGARVLALVALLAGFFPLQHITALSPVFDLSAIGAGLDSPWWMEFQISWIPRFGISVHLGIDGLSAVLIWLTYVLGVVAVLVSWRQVEERVGFFHFNLLWILSGLVGVFLALDLFLFYVFWELMLVPMYFLIGIWGHERRTYAAIKFFIFTQASGLLMLLAILGLFFLHFDVSGQLSFDYSVLSEGVYRGPYAGLLMLGFFVAFAVKLPVVPFHTWLPDAHTEAPTAGSVILAGLMLKTGAYGLFRFVLPIFPEQAQQFAPVAMWLGAIGVVYGAWLAFAQTDAKRLVAYTSVSHLGFVVLAAFSFRELALQGAVMQMICHGLSTGALFVIVGILGHRLGTRDMTRMGGLWAKLPRMGAMALFFALASLGLPGLGNFIGEFLSLAGAFQQRPAPTVVATVGLVLATVYALWLIQRVFHGEATGDGDDARDLDPATLAILGSMAVALIWLGLYPQVVFDLVADPISEIVRNAPVGR